MILLTGGSGLLGQELQKHIECIAPTREQLNLNRNSIKWLMANVDRNFHLMVHCAAFTDLVRAEKEKELCYQTNVIGTRNLALLGIPMLYISTEYVFSGEKGDYKEDDFPEPQNFYALTKLLGEYESRRAQSVVVRCLFKPSPFKHDSACVDQYTSGAYVDEIAKEIALAIKLFNKLPPTIHIGSGKRSTYELAKKSKPEVKPCKIEDIKTVKLPKDTSLNTALWERIKLEHSIRPN